MRKFAGVVPASLGFMLLWSSSLHAGDFPTFEAQEIDPHAGNVVYAVTVADVDGDGKPDVVAATEDAVLWYRNPTWERGEIVRGVTARDNVCIQPHDIDGDGRVDFALGAGWIPPDTESASTLQWLGRDSEGEWQVHPITYQEPMLHRFRWADLEGVGTKKLVVAPLQGRGTSGPDWGKGAGANILGFTIPDDPTDPDWPSELIATDLHSVHNIWPSNLDDDPADEILAAAWEGVFLIDRDQDGRWTSRKLGAGEQATSPNKGASEIKLGRIEDRPAYIATIEPWHGSKLVIYDPEGQWERTVIDEPIAWGHALWCDDLDGDGSDELVVGQRDPNPEGTEPHGPGIRVYDPEPNAETGLRFMRHIIDDGGMACEDALTADLDGDGRPEIIAGGRATHNVKIYWNRGADR